MATVYYLPTQSDTERMNTNFLDPNQCLVYVENLLPFADVDGATHIAQIIRSFITDDRLWYELLLITDMDGDRIPAFNPIIVTGDNVVSNRSVRDIQPRRIYNFAGLTLSDNIQYPLIASNFVIKDNIERPIESTSRSALGSGIYGRYIRDENNILPLRNNLDQLIYEIDCPNAYIVQDKEHGDSITVASLHINRYLDRIIQVFRSDNNLTITDISSVIRMNSIQNLVTLWNIVLYRTQDSISQEWLEGLLANYVLKYLRDNTLVDSVNGNAIQELPINDIMQSLGYEGLLADDLSNNGWDRGCVSYNYSQAVILRGDMARY